MINPATDPYRSLHAYRPIEECAPVPHDLIKLIMGYMFPMSCFLQHWNGKTDPNGVMSYLTGDSFRVLMQKGQWRSSNKYGFMADIVCLSNDYPTAYRKISEFPNRFTYTELFVSFCAQRVNILSFNAGKLEFSDDSDNPIQKFGTLPLRSIRYMHGSKDKKQVVIVGRPHEEQVDHLYLKSEGDAPLQLVEKDVAKNLNSYLTPAYCFDEDVYLFQWDKNALIFSAYDKDTAQLKRKLSIDNVGDTFFFDETTGILYYHDLVHKKLCAHHCKNGESFVLGSVTFETVLGIDVQGEVMAVYHFTEGEGSNPSKFFVSLFKLDELDKPFHEIPLDHRLEMFDQRVKLFRNKLYIRVNPDLMFEYSAPS